jgi:hypothetical protein
MPKSLKEIEKILRDDGMYIYPTEMKIVGNLGTTTMAPVNNGKEYISGHYQCKTGHSNAEKICFARRNSAAKFLRDNGFQTWTEPKSHMGGSDTYEWPLSAMRRK